MARPDLLLLHGALGARVQFHPLLPALSEHFTPHLLEFEGHGETTTDRPFRIEHFAENVIGYLHKHLLAAVDVFGYSMGGYVATWIAAHHPELVGRICTLGTKWRWTPEIAARETKMLDFARIMEKVPRFAEQLRERHTASGWERVLKMTAEMMTSMGSDNVLKDDALRRVGQRIRVGVGDRDATVSAEESTEIFRLFVQGELAVLPATPHPLERVAERNLIHLLTGFFTE